MDEISRMERILRGDNTIEPITRLEKFCAKAAGTYTGDPLTPVTRLEWFLDQISGGGGGGPTLSTFLIGFPTYTGELHYTNEQYQKYDAPEGVAYDKVWPSDEYVTWRGCQNLCEHYCASATNINQYNWRNRSNMKTIVLPNAATISTNAFQSNSNFTDLVLYNTTLVTLSGTNAFQSTQFASGGTGGTLWVPESLISAYQAATNWATILGYPNNQIKKIEGSVWE